MAAPDMEVIKEIPGYKVILKAVLKSQIQQLVEQLADHTEEETVVLTASISDGTLSHLGSASGKSFLEDHEEMKSQFLGFCLKRHHKKSQEEALKHLEMQSPSFQDHSSVGFAPRLSPGSQMGPIRMSIGSGNRQSGKRHEPYRRMRAQGQKQQSTRGLPATNQNKTDSTLSLPVSESPEKPLIKSEAETGENESSNQSHSEIGADSSVLDSSHSQQPATQATISSDLPARDLGSGPLPEGQDLHQDLSCISSNTDQLSEQNPSTFCDNSVNVKQEAGVDSDLDLQITGMEPGRSAMPGDDWGTNVSMSDTSMDMSYDTSGATGSSLDMQTGQGYNTQQISAVVDGDASNISQYLLNFTSSLAHVSTPQWQPVENSSLRCNVCAKQFKEQKYLNRHMTVHSGDKPFQCQYCNFRCNRKDNLKTHVFVRHMQT